MEKYDADMLFICSTLYVVLAATAAKLGTDKKSGSLNVFICSILLTPVVGMGYALTSPKKNVLKIVHYRCPGCGLEHTSKHHTCPTCRKEGKHRRLTKICMQTY